MGRRRTFQRSKRNVDWTGVDEVSTVGSVSQLIHQNIWTPVFELERATVTRIRGTIGYGVGLPETASQGYGIEVSVGIQVVNRAQGITGTARDPSNLDDLEGGEWLYLRQHTADIQVNAANQIFIATGDLMTGVDVDVDVKAQRVIDLSQDELLLSIAYTGTALATVTVRSYLRLLLKYGAG